MNKICSLLVMILTLLSYQVYADTAEINDAAIKIKWGYKGNIGPERWGQLSPSFALCATGKSQSPINIIKKVTNIANNLKLDYRLAPLVIVHDGITTLTLKSEKTIIDDGHSIQVNFPVKTKEFINLEGVRYRLVQFHFHSPSEDQWQKRSFPLEIHFVHQSDTGEVAVIGVFVNGGAASPDLQEIIDNLPNDVGIEHVIKGEDVNPAGFMPSKKDYYRFDGSLTTPPCTEGLHWAMMMNPITASPAQILEIRKAIGGSNARPVQALNKRKISFSTIN